MKYIRNDCTLLCRLKRLAEKKLEQEKQMSIFDKKLPPVFKLHMKINNLIEEIEEDMRLNVLQKNNNDKIIGSLIVDGDSRGFHIEYPDGCVLYLEDIINGKTHNIQ